MALQRAFEPQQIHQIREIWEAKSHQGKAIEELHKRAQDLEADLSKSRAEANDAFENGRMVAILGLNGQWEANFALEQQHGQLEEPNRQIAEKDQKLSQFRAEAEAYKTNVEDEARRYKQAAEEKIRAQKEALKAAESAKSRVESLISEKMQALALAEPYIEGLEKKVAGFESHGEAAERAENVWEDQQKLLDQSQSYAKGLEKRLAELEKEQSSEEAAQRRREEELGVEGKINDFEAIAEETTRSNELSAQETKGLNEELRRVSGDL